MGQFTSPCPNCGHNLHWFLEVGNQVCKNCGIFRSSDEIKKTWNDYYSKNLEQIEEKKDNKHLFIMEGYYRRTNTQKDVLLVRIDRVYHRCNEYTTVDLTFVEPKHKLPVDYQMKKVMLCYSKISHWERVS